MQRIFICIQRFIAIELPETFIVMQTAEDRMLYTCANVQTVHVSVSMPVLLYVCFVKTRSAFILHFFLYTPLPFSSCPSILHLSAHVSPCFGLYVFLSFSAPPY